MCENQYYIEYVLGHRGKSGQKADMGTIVHKVMETLALVGKANQDGKTHIKEDDVFGEISVKDVEAMSLDEMVIRVFNHYKEKTPHHIWRPAHLRDCKAWSHKVIDLNNGTFDPRKRKIIDAEPHFDFEIKEPWAKYEYKVGERKVSGNLCMKGTIDLITDVGSKSIEIIDYKTGKRLDWATGKEKTYSSLMTDPQLRIYHYAASQMYPDIDNFIITIYFINDGGPFSLCFSKKDLTFTKDMLKKKFEKIKSTMVPKLSKSWKCQRLCPFGKSSFEKPLKEMRSGQFTAKGEDMTICQEIEYMTKKMGMDYVNEHYTKDGHDITFYKAPGSADG